MKGRLLPFVIIGIVFFLSAVSWQWSRFSSTERRNSDVGRSYTRKELRSEASEGKRVKFSKLGLQQVELGAISAANEQQSISLDQRAAKGASKTTTLQDAAIILFCYDR